MRISLIRASTLAALTVLSAATVAALDPEKTLTQYAHRVWGQEEGLFQPTIYSILQTRDGFLWLGTQDSLIRFDGMHFREYRPEETGFHRNLIRDLAEDRQGSLWVASVGAGIAKITPDRRIVHYTTKDGLASDSTFSVAPDSHGDVWISTNQGLARFHEGRFRVFRKADGLPDNQIRSTCETPDGSRWVAGFDFGLARWNGARFESYSDAEIRPTDNITALACASDGTLWAGKTRGLVQIGKGFSRLLTKRDGLPDDAVSALAEGPEGSLWIGTNDGITRYRNGEMSVYRTRDGLSHTLVLSLYIDREGSLWAGTKDGLDQFTDGKVIPYTVNEGMSANETGPVLEDAQGRLWAGTLGNGLNWFDRRRFHTLTTRNGLIENTILSLQLDKDGDLWVGTRQGLNRLRNARVVAAYTTKDGLPGSEIRALFVDMNGTLWAGTEKGLSRFNGRRFVQERAVSGNATGGVLALAGGKAVHLFVSTDTPRFYFFYNGVWNSQWLDIIRPVDCYSLDHERHSAWMGTLGSGLLRWQKGGFVHVRIKDGLYDNRIYSILRDNNANFWMASSKGIFRVSEKELDDFADGRIRSVTSIPFSTGQLRFECQSGVQPAACRTRDGRLWFSTNNGLVVVDPNRLVKNRIPPPVQITSVFLNGRQQSTLDDIDLEPSEKNLEIRYAGLSFISPEKVSFRYMLEGYDKTWVDAGTRREAFYTNLPPGHFRFKVLASNADAIWSTNAAVLRFAVEPRLFQRIWFFPLAALAVAIAIFGGYRIRIRQMRRRFDLVLAERSRIARELHDTLLQGLAGITMQLQALWNRLPASKERQFLGEIIHDAGKCSAEARRSLWGLRTVGPKSLAFSSKLENVSREAVNGRGISLSLNLAPVSLNTLPAVEYQLLRITQEVIANVLAHADAKSIEIYLRVREECVELTIEDDGVGFDPGGQTFGHFGLVGMRERADEIGAELAVTSIRGRGTTVSIRLPIGNAGQESNIDAGLEHHRK